MKRYLIILIILASCITDYETEPVKKIVNAKTETKNEFLIGFTDATQLSVSFGIYSVAEVGDTMCFECQLNRRFNRYNCLYDTIIKPNK